MAGRERGGGRLYESGYKKRMKKKEQEIRNALNLQKNKNITEFFTCDKLDSPSAVENSASSTILDVSCEERYLFQQDVNAKEKYDEEQKTQMLVV